MCWRYKSHMYVVNLHLLGGWCLSPVIIRRKSLVRWSLVNHRATQRYTQEQDKLLCKHTRTHNLQSPILLPWLVWGTEVWTEIEPFHNNRDKWSGDSKRQPTDSGKNSNEPEPRPSQMNNLLHLTASTVDPYLFQVQYWLLHQCKDFSRGMKLQNICKNHLFADYSLSTA